jgi:hypothetical protein
VKVITRQFIVILILLILTLGLKGSDNMSNTQKIKWKKQHVRNGCASASMAMLLSEYKIKLEDYEVIERALMPYLIRFDSEEQSYYCGVKVQDSEVFSIVANSYNLKLTEVFLDNWDEYLTEAKSMNKPFLTSASIKYLKSPGYDNFRDMKSRRGHAIVVEKVENNTFYILDPDGGIPRNEQQKFHDIKENVYYQMSFDEFKEAVEFRGVLIISYLSPTDHLEKQEIKLLQETLSVIEKLPSIVDAKISNFTKKADYDNFYNLLCEVVFPFTIDLHATLECISSPSINEQKAISLLEELLDKSMEIKNNLKSDPIFNTDSYLDYLSENLNSFSNIYSEIVRKKMDEL